MQWWLQCRIQFAVHTWYLITSPAEVGMEEVPNIASYRWLAINSKRKSAVVQEHSDSPCSAEISATEGGFRIMN